MKEIVRIYKKLGETPLEALNRLRYERLEFANQKMTYLGRLDPMAEGLLLVLVGEMDDKEEYLKMDKEYEFEVLWGFETDTYDLLGVATADTDSLALNPQVGSDATRELVSAFAPGRRVQKYPPYSSKYWQKARAGEDLEIPEREIMIYSFENLGDRRVSGTELLGDIEDKISKVRGDFRQGEIIESWRTILHNASNSEFLISKFKAHVSSGTYIRSLAYEMGGVAYSIKRTKVGNYKI